MITCLGGGVSWAKPIAARAVRVRRREILDFMGFGGTAGWGRSVADLIWISLLSGE
jgi:hypothetical protein